MTALGWRKRGGGVMAHGDGGKGSGRRQEDVKKIHDNWDLIFGSKKKDAPMIEEEETEICPHCSGSGEGRYEGQVCRNCNGYGEVPVDSQEEDDEDEDYE